MKIQIHRFNDVTVVELQGELDGDDVELFQTTITDIIAEDRAGVVLDMSGVGFIDGEG